VSRITAGDDCSVTLLGADASALAKTFGVALAVGLDVFALSIAIGIAGAAWRDRARVGLAFVAAELIMQVLGALIGTGAGRLLGEIAAYAGFAVLAILGAWMIKESFGEVDGQAAFDATQGWGLLAASVSISLDSLGVGFSLPALGISLAPLLLTVAVTTIVFTLAGLAFGAGLGARFKAGAERTAGVVLVLLGLAFAAQHAFVHG
jgi:putative Mn2+ efflux pump MntP